MKACTLYIVIPCYNEQEVLNETASRLKVKFNALLDKNIISNKSKILFVNDGSKDNTWSIIEELNSNDDIFCGVSLAHNKGHQTALLAGLFSAYKNKPDAVISIDADLQDDINAIDEMLKAFYDGNDVVYGVRSNRDSDTFFKKLTAESFYKFMEFMGVETIFNHADYRLLSFRALDSLLQYNESNLYLRGIVPNIGYKSSTVEYSRSARFAGESKYPLKKMFALAWEGVTSFTTKPLSLILVLGFVFSFVAFLGLIALIILTCCAVNFNDILWLTAAIVLMCGIQLISLGIIGQYVGKGYIESKHRPRFFIDKEIL